MTMKDVKEAIRFVFTCDFWRMGLFWTFALYYSYFQLLKARIFPSKSTPISASSIGSSRPICVITGATSGLGKATAFALSDKGFYVVLVGRSSQLLSETLKEIKRQCLLDSELHPSIQLLVNNAGIMATSSRPTTEGYDRIMATNYIGPFYLTKLLLPLLKNSSVPSRVVNVSSFAHRYASFRKFDKHSVTGAYLLTLNRYPCAKVYEYSKLCILLFSYELHRQLRLTDDSHHVSVIAADPGLAKTNLMREFPKYIVSMVFATFRVLGLLQSPDKGAESFVDAALAPPETSGAYYFGGKGRTIKSSKVSRDPKLAKQLWETSCDLFNEMTMKDVKEALLFVLTSDYWRMVLFWTSALVSSYLQLFKAKIFGSKSTPISTSINLHNASSRPICVITGTLKEFKSKIKNAQLRTFQADMSSLQSILKFKNSLEQWLSDSKLHPSIQLLVNNAGIVATSSGPTTIEGYDRMMATNYIGPFYLTKLLLPLLKNSSVPSRVVNVSSFTHRYVSLRKFDKVSVTGEYLPALNQYPFAKVYEYSKLCILLFSYELHRQLRLTDDSHHVSVIAADPGFAKTNLMREFPVYIVPMVFLFVRVLGLLQSSDQGAESFVDAALAPPEISGAYYFGGKGRTIVSSKVSKDPKLAKQLWETSSDLFNELHHSN
ncbi:hypothetical protein AALP_AA8G167400 [Arabis alpina]|uniref:Uncharacterized protein n=1 Tax=Arabis alpina TaxID=50452 RepID=A0A087G7H8_ARAAL|nr:hypothetical protein AALP_AA8G167400 [Arabis alpina]